jgi:hypothetical protein
VYLDYIPIVPHAASLVECGALMPTLPTPLTEDGLRFFMRDPRYRDPAHAEHDLVRSTVVERYRRLYPGPSNLMPQVGRGRM